MNNPNINQRNKTVALPNLLCWSSFGPSLFLVALSCWALLSAARAVNPPPDGGYPNGNTAEGDFALNDLTTGSNNTAVGPSALFNNKSGSNNTAIGPDALLNNTGNDNTATGAVALENNTTGALNTATGVEALLSNIDG